MTFFMEVMKYSCLSADFLSAKVTIKVVYRPALPTPVGTGS